MNIKKLTYPVTGILFLLTVTQALASNTGDTCPAGNFAYLCNVSIGTVVGGFITLLFILAGLIALFYLVWGGIKWLTSGGDKSNIEAAQGHIVAAIIGLVIILVSYVIVNLLWQFFFGTNLTNIGLPTIKNGTKTTG